jgi:hypothetical protein
MMMTYSGFGKDENMKDIANGKYSLWHNGDIIVFDVGLIKSLPDEVKTIIAFYSIFLPAKGEESDTILAHALGNYATTDEAQQDLLTGNFECFDKIYTDLRFNLLLNLDMEIENHTFYFVYQPAIGQARIDKFVIKNHSITYIEKPDGNIMTIFGKIKSNPFDTILSLAFLTIFFVGLIFVSLKLFKVIDWKWIKVAIPFIINISILILMGIVKIILDSIYGKLS